MEKTETKKQIKVYHVNGSIGYSNWITNRELVNKMEDADLVFFEGGADVDPAFYGEKAGRYTSNHVSTDRREYAAFKKAVELNKPMFGTCKGMQVFVALHGEGGRLIQDQDHPGRHNIITKEGKKFSVNSLHHQAVYPYGMPKESYEVLCWTDEILSDTHTDGEGKEMGNVEGFQEIEGIYLPKIKALGVQHHPEFMWRGNVDEYFAWLYSQVKDKLGLEITNE